jgi:hypothetical protein
MSASAPHGGAWLCPLPGAIPLVWFPASAFVALLAFRLGLPVMDGAVVPRGAPSAGCRALKTCGATMRCPARRRGGRCTTPSATPFFGSRPRPAGRPAWRLRRSPARRCGRPARGPRRVFVVDVAVVHPLATAHLRAAQRSAAGAATAYEAVKREHYAPAMADAPEAVELVPLVFETYGGHGVPRRRPFAVPSC